MTDSVPSVISVALPNVDLTADERALMQWHMNRLGIFQMKNREKEAYYEGRQRLRRLGFSIPPKLQDLSTIVGWPGTAVDVLEERLDFLGWTGGDAFGLDEVYAANGLDADAPLATVDALISGSGFVVVGKGDAGDPDALVTVESPNAVTGDWDGRMRRLRSALSLDEIDDEGQVLAVTLYGLDEDVRVARDSATGVWSVEDRDRHGHGRVKVVQLINRPRASRTSGRSEITRAVRAYTDQAVRTLLGMEVNREFYAAPQRYIVGAGPEAFQDGSGESRTGWESVMGRMLAIPNDADAAEKIQVGQFSAASPQPFLEQIRGLAQLLSAESAIPQTYLGFTSDNPPSADAIHAMEARLLKRAERRQAVFGRAWREVAALALLVRDGSLPDGFDRVSPKWQDPATPTRAAASDAAVKLVGAEILPADSSVTYDLVGLSQAEQATLQSDRRRGRSSQRLADIAAAIRGGGAVNGGNGGGDGDVSPGSGRSGDAGAS